MDKYISSYISGITNLASSISKDIGPSYVECYAFNKDNFINEFNEYFDIKYNIELIDTNNSLNNVLISLYGNNKELIESIEYWISLNIGDYIKVLTYNNSNILSYLSNSEGGNTNFYTVEDIYFIEYKDIILCFILGNNE